MGEKEMKTKASKRNDNAFFMFLRLLPFIQINQKHI
jgi:hypothetical protein